MRTALAWLVLIAPLGACSARSGGPPQPPGSAAPPGDAAATAPPPSAIDPTERDCDELLSHTIAIKVADQRQKLPPEQVPTEAEQAALRTELRASFIADCRAGSRADHQCGLAAKTLAELDACQPR